MADPQPFGRTAPAPNPAPRRDFLPVPADPAASRALFGGPPPAGIEPPAPMAELGAEDLPGFKAKLHYQLAQVAARDPEQLGDIVTELVPGAKTYRLGQTGPLAVEMPDGKRYYLNRPGVSRADAVGVVSDLVSGIVAATGAGKAMQALRVPRVAQWFGQGLAAAGSSVGLDLGAGALGSKQGVSGDRATLAGIGGTAGEAFAPAVGRLVNYLRTWPGARLLDNAGGLTETARRAFAEAGIDPAALSAQQLQAVGEALRDAGLRAGSDALELARRATEAATPDEFAIRRTQGQRTGDPVQLQREDALRYGAGGPGARDTVRTFDELQRQDVDRAFAATTERMTGRPAMDEPTVGQEVMAGGRARFTAAEEAENAAWQAFRDANPRGFTIAPEAAPQLAEASRRAVADFPLSEGTPTANRLLRDLERAGRDAEGNPVALDLLEADRLRRMFTAANPADPQDRRAVGLLRGAFDDWLYGLLDRGLATGGADQVDLLRDAIGASREKWSLIRPPNVSRTVEQRLRSLVDDDLNGQQVANWLYGAGQLSGAGESRQTIGAVQNLVGDNASAREAIRQGALVRIFEGATENAGGYQRIADRIREALAGNGREVSEFLFTEVERQELGRFEQSLRQLARQRTPQNPSGSGWTLAGALVGGSGIGAGLLAAFGDTLVGAGGSIAGSAVAGSAVSRAVGQGMRDIVGERAAGAATAPGSTGQEVARNYLGGTPLNRLLRATAPAAGATAAKPFDQ
jgi:hypothetical protein